MSEKTANVALGGAATWVVLTTGIGVCRRCACQGDNGSRPGARRLGLAGRRGDPPGAGGEPAASRPAAEAGWNWADPVRRTDRPGLTYDVPVSQLRRTCRSWSSSFMAGLDVGLAAGRAHRLRSLSVDMYTCTIPKVNDRTEFCLGCIGAWYYAARGCLISGSALWSAAFSRFVVNDSNQPPLQPLHTDDSLIVSKLDKYDRL